jgi:hypothetical protein
MKDAPRGMGEEARTEGKQEMVTVFMPTADSKAEGAIASFLTRLPPWEKGQGPHILLLTL